MDSENFVSALQALSFPDTFNPYSAKCPVHDRSDAPLRRARAVKMLLQAAMDREVDAIWIGRDLGYRGGRRTGLALTDDVHIASHGARWGLDLARPTNGTAVIERTAAVIWEVLSEIDVAVFLWNVFPLHPHEPGDPFTNRAHKSHERRAGEEVLSALIGLIQPRRVVAIGNDAASSAGRVASHLEIVRVRHPSYGGQTEFLKQIRCMYPCQTRMLI
jgi:hypothetical protein